MYWKQAQTGDWALTDDNYVSECYDRKDYTDKNGKTKTFIKLTCGVGWDTQFSKINYELNRTYGVYSKPTLKGATMYKRITLHVLETLLPHMHRWSLMLERWTIKLSVKSIDLTRKVQRQQLEDSLNKKYPEKWWKRN